MRVVPIPVNEDNYQYLIVDERTKKAAIVDPVDVEKIITTAAAENAQLCASLVTHHHNDHAAGTEELSRRIKQQNPDFRTYAGEQKRIAGVDEVPKHKGEFSVGNLKVTALRTPCHTSTHVSFFIEDGQTGQHAVFTGDTLFIGGCGKFFEGNAEQMHINLNIRLAVLPDDTRVYCGHEYTVDNLKFARTVEPDNKHVEEKLAWAQQERAAGHYTIPSTLAQEKTFNPFMRVGESSLQKSLEVKDAVAVMAKLRELKNNFRG